MRNIKLLIIDDNQGILNALKLLLKTEYESVKTISNRISFIQSLKKVNRM
jgi:DNA-binding NtrC family response regulator